MRKGKLKLFIGIASNPQTTRAMLLEAWDMIDHGIDAVVGRIDPGGCGEIEKLLNDMEMVPGARISRGDASTREMDVTAILKRNPDVVLIDDLAHAGSPGPPRRTRHQDIRIILDNGIDVTATVGIETIESLVPVIEEITGKKSRGSVPDTVIEAAESIRLIDIPPEESHAKGIGTGSHPSPVANPAQAHDIATATALREIALNYTSFLVNKQLVDLKNINRLDNRWKNSPGFLVAISPSPHSRYLIKWTRRTAFERKVPWLAVYIQTGRELSQEENRMLKGNMKLVEDLGAELIISMDDDIPGGIIRVARQHAISHIVIGKPRGYKPTGPFSRFSIIDTLISESGEIDIFVVSEQSAEKKRTRLIPGILSRMRANGIREYLLVSLWLLVLVAVNLFLFRFISYLSIGFIFLAAVSVVSSLHRKGPVLYFASLSALLWNVLFLQPRFTIYIDHLEDLFMFLMYFITAFIIGNLTTRLRQKETFLRKREKNLEELYVMGKILNGSSDQDEIIRKSMSFLRSVFSVNTAMLLRGDDNDLSMKTSAGSDFELPGEEREAALWCFTNRRPAGKYSDNLSDSRYHYIPLQTGSVPAGVLVMDFGDKRGLSIEQGNLLEALVAQVAAAIERNAYYRSQQKIKVAEESEKLYQIVLNLVSHELRTPITTIASAANALIDEKLGGDTEVRTIFSNDIIEASDRLNRIVDNLLGSMRIESDNITLNMEWYDISELIGTVVRKLGTQLKGHDFTYEIDKNLPMVKFDFNLMEQLLTNLIYNAALYTPHDSRIWLKVAQEGDLINISVSDDGPGIPDGEKENIFKKFYRSKTVRTGGLGLGLSICKEIAEIHKGGIDVDANSQGGASFIVRLPLLQNRMQGDI